MIMSNSTYNQLTANLDLLKLTQMKLHLDEIRDFVTTNGLSFTEGLLKLSSYEVDFKEQNASRSMIRRRYLPKCFNLASRRFSNCARFNCCNKSLHLIKYVLACFLAAAIPIDVARCVFPTPLGPKNTIFSFFSRKPRLASSLISCSFTLG